jgi:hypothetical protein
MRKLVIIMLMACILTISAAAAYIPDNEVCENRDGRQLIIKTFTLAPWDDPEPLIEDTFEREGYLYSHISIVKEEKPYEHRKLQSETVTIETASKDFSIILAEFETTIAFDDGVYSGVLTLDHTSLETEATGYSRKKYTVSTTKTIEGLERNDPGLVPKTEEKDGATLSLQNIEWSVAGYASSGDELFASQYTAVATYSAVKSYNAADGYITAATYTGEVVSGGVEDIVYTVTYSGMPVYEPVPEPIAEPESEPVSEPEPEPEHAPVMLYIIIAILSLISVTACILAFHAIRKANKALTPTYMEEA